MDKINQIQITEGVLLTPFRFISFRDNLLYSIFEGEYYNDSFEEKISSLILELENIFESLPKSSYPPRRLEFITNRFGFATDYLLHYQYLNQFVINRIKDNYSTKIYNFEYEDVFSRISFFKEDTVSLNDSFHWLFVANIKLAEMDEGYCVDEKTILVLSEIFHKLDRIDLSLEFFISKTRIKCSILLYKILRRLQKTDPDVKYSIFNDEKITILELEKIIPLDIVENINLQYDCEENKEIYSGNKEIEELIKGEFLDIRKTHRYLKLVKLKNNYTDFEFQKTLKILENINKYFSEKIKVGNLDNIPYKTIGYLVLNRKFNLECNQSIKSLSKNFKFDTLEKINHEIDKQFHEINSSENSDYPNCILNKIYVKKKIEIIEIIEKRNLKELNDEDYDYFSLLEIIFKNTFKELNNLKNKIKTCQKNKIMPLYLELKDCNLIDNTFIDSQYILPSNYEFLMEDCEKNRDELKLKENIFYSFTPKTIKELNEKLRKDIKEQQYSIITVIGLYASFITFILANVNVLPELIKHSIGSVLAFMLVFGVVLFYFIASLKLLFTAKKVFKSINNFILWTILGFILIVAGFIAIFKNINTNFKKEIQSKKTTTTITTYDVKTGKKQSETKTFEQNIDSEQKDSLK